MREHFIKMKKKRFTVTSALLYANGPLHVGHIAGAYLPADIYVRYLKKKGHDVAFICGSDEHGAAITLQSKKDGVSPQEIVDNEDDSTLFPTATGAEVAPTFREYNPDARIGGSITLIPKEKIRILKALFQVRYTGCDIVSMTRCLY